jgi:hypothetical protein
MDHALGDVTGDGKLDVIGNIATGSLTARDGGGAQLHEFTPTPPGGEHQDRSFIANAFDYPIVADIDPVSPGPEVAKAGLTLQGAANLLAVGQNQPFNHVLQAWNGENGNSLPAYPQNTEDYVLLSSPGSANVSDAPGNELIVGTGLYLLRSMNAQGIEGTGWPKFTGGWIMTVPATGDTDGDGKLEVTTVTREGNAFMWDTDQPACGGNDEWWTAHHDEFSTRAYGTDSRPPGTPGALTATRRGGQIELRWTAPGDDWLCGDGKTFRVLGADGELRSPRQGIQLAEGPAAALGASQTLTIDAGDRRTLGVMHLDEAGNPGHLATVAVPQAEGDTTRSPQGGSFGGGGGDTAPGIPPAQPSTPETPPTATISAPRFASDAGRSSQFKVSWRGTAASFDVDIRGGRGVWKPLLRETTLRSLRYRGKAGRGYSFRVRPRAASGLLGAYATATTIVPYDDRAKRIAYSGGWRRPSARPAYGRSLSAGPRYATARMRFRGSRVALIAPRDEDGGRLGVYVDGRRLKVIHLRGEDADRVAVYGSPKLSRKRVHTLVVRVLSRGSARLDAIAVTP